MKLSAILAGAFTAIAFASRMPRKDPAVGSSNPAKTITIGDVNAMILWNRVKLGGRKAEVTVGEMCPSFAMCPNGSGITKLCNRPGIKICTSLVSSGWKGQALANAIASEYKRNMPPKQKVRVP